MDWLKVVAELSSPTNTKVPRPTAITSSAPTSSTLASATPRAPPIFKAAEFTWMARPTLPTPMKLKF
eukprot:8534479-Pyramimonas_sp.AAC.1